MKLPFRKVNTIGKQVVALNLVLVTALLCVFSCVLVYANNRVKEEVQAYNQQILSTIRKSFSTESFRLTTLAATCQRDAYLIIGSANSLGISELTDRAPGVGERLKLIQNSLPYADNVFLYVNNSRQIISSDGYLFREDWYLKGHIESRLAEGETLPDFTSMRSGFYTYENFTLYVCNLFENGSVVILLNAGKLFNLTEIYSLLPSQEVLILDEDNKVFAASSIAARELYGSLGLAEKLDDGRESWQRGKYQITHQQIRGSEFHYLAIGRNSPAQNRQLWFSYVVVFSALIIGALCFFIILLNMRVYRPLRQMVMKISTSDQQNELEIISGRINELATENIRLTQQTREQLDVQLDMALNHCLRLSDPPDAKLTALLQAAFERYQVIVIAAQRADGGILLQGGSDSYLVDTLSGRPVHLDGYVHAYVIPVDQPAGDALPGSPLEEITANLEACFSDRAEGDTVFVGISDVSGDVLQLHDAFEQAQRRMMAARVPADGGVSVCAEDSSLTESSIIPLEIQNTVVECTRSGGEAELESVLSRIFDQSRELTLRGYLSVCQTLVSLLHIVLSSANVDSDLQASLLTLKKPVFYNPRFMHQLVLEDFCRVNRSCSGGQSLPRYQIIEYIQQNYMNPLSLETIAAAFDITPVYLSTWFKKNMGINLSTHIANVRMEEAKRLLLENRGLKVQEVAETVGIPSISTFIRQFKNYTGTTPDQYRKLN